MSGKSKYELEIVNNVIVKRTERGKSQAYIAMILNVTEGYIGQIESHRYPSMYTHDQLNEIAKDFGCSPKDFHPSDPIDQSLKAKDQENNKVKKKKIINFLVDKITEGYFKKERYVGEIITEINKKEEFEHFTIVNADITNALRSFTSDRTLTSRKEGNRNVYIHK